MELHYTVHVSVAHEYTAHDSLNLAGWPSTNSRPARHAPLATPTTAALRSNRPRQRGRCCNDATGAPQCTPRDKFRTDNPSRQAPAIVARGPFPAESAVQATQGWHAAIPDWAAACNLAAPIASCTCRCKGVRAAAASSLALPPHPQPDLQHTQSSHS